MVVIKLFKGKSKFSRFVSDNFWTKPQRMILFSFLVVILAGSFVLSLPLATVNPGGLPFIDALFTATSATCVTGLIVVDTATVFTEFGQWTILILIQLGGLGIMTFSTFFMFLFIGSLTIHGRDILIDTLSQNPILELGKLVKTVFLFTGILEISGALLLAWAFLPDHTWHEALYYGLFHSISAFCNAGFSITEGGYLPYASDWYFCLVNMLLIIAGGLGFIVIYDLRVQLPHLRSGFFRRLSLHTRVVLMVSTLLIGFGAVIFLALEMNQSMANQSWYEKILIALFQSVTTRTAGFNTTSINQLAQPTLFMLLIFMFIGASPGSCGGGIKTTTFSLFIKNLAQQFSNNKDINLFYRRIPTGTLSRAISIVFFAIFTVIIFVFLLLLSETYFQEPKPEIHLMSIVFEVISAFGTVGLSMGITEFLSPTGKVLITLLMYIGRLGPLTLVFALKIKENSEFRYMKEDILVG